MIRIKGGHELLYYRLTGGRLYYVPTGQTVTDSIRYDPRELLNYKIIPDNWRTPDD